MARKKSNKRTKRQRTVDPDLVKKKIIRKLLGGIESVIGTKATYALVVIGIVSLFYLSISEVHVSDYNYAATFIHNLTKAPPKAYPDYYNVLIAKLENDLKNESRTVIVEELKELEGVKVLCLDEEIPLDGPDPEKLEDEGYSKAEEYLEKTGAQIMLWGKVIEHAGKPVPKLYWAVAEGVELEKKFGRYEIGAENRLPEVFVNDLAYIIAMLVVAKSSEVLDQDVQYLTNQLPVFISKCENLLSSNDAKPIFSPVGEACIRYYIGIAQMTYSEQTGDDVFIRYAINNFRLVSETTTNDGYHELWANSQYNLGNALAILGERENDYELLKEAEKAYNAGLKVYTRQDVPLKWAFIQNGLGTVLARLGEQEVGTEGLEKSVGAFKEVLKVLACERDSYIWAVTQNNLGGALQLLGEREPGTDHQEEAVEVCMNILTENTRRKTPALWAMTQNNLGNALSDIGEKTGNINKLEEAALHYRLALEVWQEDNTPYYHNAAIENLEKVETLIREMNEKEK